MTLPRARTARLLPIAVAIVAAAMLVGCGGSSSSKSGHANITIWEGYTGVEASTFKKLVAEYNASHPGVTVTPQFNGGNDYALQKVLAAVAGGNPPDIAYLYGSYSANIATSPGVVTLNNRIAADPSLGWNEFWPVSREVASVGNRIIGVPALVDNLALVYNKRLFAQAGLATPTAAWTWKDFENAAIKLTDPSKKQFGWAYVADGSEDTVWRFWALLWQAGGKILTPDGKQAAFDSPAGVRAMTLLKSLSQRHAIYLDAGNEQYLGLFTSGHVGMLWTGPWDLPSILEGHEPYGVQILAAEQNHQTISGPDNWVMFNNGSARVDAAWNFLTWFTSAQNDLRWSTDTGDLPVRRDVKGLPGYTRFVAKYPGVGTWAANLNNALQSRPATPSYSKLSTVVGQAVQAVLLGKAQPEAALHEAAQQVNTILATSG